MTTLVEFGFALAMILLGAAPFTNAVEIGWGCSREPWVACLRESVPLCPRP